MMTDMKAPPDVIPFALDKEKLRERLQMLRTGHRLIPTGDDLLKGFLHRSVGSKKSSKPSPFNQNAGKGISQTSAQRHFRTLALKVALSLQTPLMQAEQSAPDMQYHILVETLCAAMSGKGVTDTDTTGPEDNGASALAFFPLDCVDDALGEIGLSPEVALQLRSVCYFVRCLVDSALTSATVRQAYGQLVPENPEHAHVSPKANDFTNSLEQMIVTQMENLEEVLLANKEGQLKGTAEMFVYQLRFLKAQLSMFHQKYDEALARFDRASELNTDLNTDYVLHSRADYYSRERLMAFRQACALAKDIHSSPSGTTTPDISTIPSLQSALQTLHRALHENKEPNVTPTADAIQPCLDTLSAASRILATCDLPKNQRRTLLEAFHRFEVDLQGLILTLRDEPGNPARGFAVIPWHGLLLVACAFWWTKRLNCPRWQSTMDILRQGTDATRSQALVHLRELLLNPPACAWAANTLPAESRAQKAQSMYKRFAFLVSDVATLHGDTSTALFFAPNSSPAEGKMSIDEEDSHDMRKTTTSLNHVQWRHASRFRAVAQWDLVSESLSSVRASLKRSRDQPEAKSVESCSNHIHFLTLCEKHHVSASLEYWTLEHRHVPVRGDAPHALDVFLEDVKALGRSMSRKPTLAESFAIVCHVVQYSAPITPVGMAEEELSVRLARYPWSQLRKHLQQAQAALPVGTGGASGKRDETTRPAKIARTHIDSEGEGLEDFSQFVQALIDFFPYVADPSSFTPTQFAEGFDRLAGFLLPHSQDGAEPHPDRRVLASPYAPPTNAHIAPETMGSAVQLTDIGLAITGVLGCAPLVHLFYPLLSKLVVSAQAARGVKVSPTPSSLDQPLTIHPPSLSSCVIELPEFDFLAGSLRGLKVEATPLTQACMYLNHSLQAQLKPALSQSQAEVPPSSGEAHAAQHWMAELLISEASLHCHQGDPTQVVECLLQSMRLLQPCHTKFSQTPIIRDYRQLQRLIWSYSAIGQSVIASILCQYAITQNSPKSIPPPGVRACRFVNSMSVLNVVAKDSQEFSQAFERLACRLIASNPKHIDFNLSPYLWNEPVLETLVHSLKGQPQQTAKAAALAVLQARDWNSKSSTHQLDLQETFLGRLMLTHM